jgi:hypothetical protein
VRVLLAGWARRGSSRSSQEHGDETALHRTNLAVPVGAAPVDPTHGSAGRHVAQLPGRAPPTPPTGGGTRAHGVRRPSRDRVLVDGEGEVPGRKPRRSRRTGTGTVTITVEPVRPRIRRG